MKNFFRSSLFKDTLRTIKNSLARYLAIIAMTGLSAMVFIGLQAGVPNLKQIIVNRVTDHKMHDLKIASYTGLREKDIAIINSLPGKKSIEYKSNDTFNLEDEDYSINLYTITDKIDTFIVKKGRLPKNKQEIALDYLHFEDHGDMIGKKIKFKNKDEDTEKSNLKNLEFTIVGYVYSIDYIGNTRRSSNSASYFGAVTRDALMKEYPDQALITYQENSSKDISDNSYKLYETNKVEDVRKLFENRPNQVKDEIIADANKDINEAKKELEDGKEEIADGKKKLVDAKKDLDDAKKEIDDGQEKLDDAKKELDESEVKLADGRKEIDDGKEQLRDSKKELDDAKKELDQGQAKLNEGKEEYKKNKEIFDDEINSAKRKLQDGQSKIDQAQAELNNNKEKYQKSLNDYNNGLKEIEKNRNLIKDGLNQIEDKKTELEKKESDLISQKEDLDESLQQVKAGIESTKSQIPPGMTRETAELMGFDQILAAFDILDELTEQEQMLEAGIEKINDGLNKIDSGKNSIKQNEKELTTSLEKLEQEEDKAKAGKKELDEASTKLEQGQKQIDENQKELDKSKNLLDDQEAQGKAKLNEAKDKLDKAEAELNDGRQKYERGLDKYNKGLDEIEQAEKDYKKGLAKFQDGKEKYLDAKKELEDGKKEYEKGKKDYEEGLEEFESKTKDANKKIADAEKEIEDVEDKLANLTVPMYNVQGKYGNIAFYSFIDQSNSLNYLSYIFTLLFYFVAILVTLTTVLRMVETERTQIGTLKALGYNKNSIMMKFMTYGLSATVIGCLLGILIGYFILMPPIIKAYTASSNLTEIPGIYELDKPILILVTSMILIGLTIYLTVNSSLKENAANLMRPKPPKEAKRTLLEKIPFIWNKLSFLNKVSIRNLFRNKIRMFMTIIGIAGSFGLMAMGLGIQTSIGNVAPKQFDQIYKFDAQVMYNDQADDSTDFEKFLKEKSSNSIKIISQNATVKTPEGFNEDINIMATNQVDSFDQFVSLKDRASDKKFKLEDGSVIISEKLSNTQDLKVGSMFKFKDINGMDRQLKVSAITEQYFNHSIYMTKTTYKDLVNKKQTENSYLINLKDTSDKNVNQVRNIITDFEACNAFIPILDLQDSLDNLNESMKPVILLIIAVSALLALVVLYNLTNINISERIREISTIKVLGFRPNEVVTYIFKENLILTFFGILLGIGLAKLMHSIIVFYLSPGAFQFDPQMMPSNFIIASVLIIAFTLLVMLISKRDMDKIDMVEALKAAE